MSRYTVRFPEHHQEYPPLTLEADTPLAEHFDASNSPVLFGCRTGICGTCLVEIESEGPLPPPEEDEKEILDIYAEDNPLARLCCQVKLRAHCSIRILAP